MTVDETAIVVDQVQVTGSSAPADRLAGCLGGGQVWVQGIPVESLWDGISKIRRSSR